MDFLQVFDYFAQKKILYVHGFGSSGASNTVKLLSQKMPQATFLHPDLPIEPLDMLPFLQDLCRKEQPDLIIGTSMGGMLVEKLRGYDRICVNPALHMDTTLGQTVKYGETDILSPRQDGITKINVTKAMGKAFGEVCAKNFEGLDEDDALRVTGLFGTEDNFINNYDEFRQYYPLSAYFEGGHRLIDKVVLHTLMPIIRRYWVKQAGLMPKTIFVDIDTLCMPNGKQQDSARIAFETLQQNYEVYVVASAAQQPQEWLLRNIGIGAWRRLILTDEPNILLGDYYITKNPRIEQSFLGTTLLHGSSTFKHWEALLDFFEQLSGQ